MNQSDDLKLKRAVQLLCSTGIRRPMSMEKIKIWLKQFDPGPEQTLALLILRHLIYRTTDQIESSLIQALRKMTLHFAVNNSDREEFNWKDILGGKTNLSFIFGPPAHEYTKPGKSGELIIRLLKQIFPLDSNQIQYPGTITKLEEDERYLMIDDGTFTGDQLSGVIEQFGGMMKSPGKTGIIVSIAHERALEKLQKTYPGIPIFFGEKMSHQDGLLELSNRWISEGNWPYIEITPYEVYQSVVETKCRFEEKQPLGYAGLGLLVAYEHGIPDDSLQFLWGKSESWTPLFNR